MSEPVRRNLLSGLKPRDAAADDAAIAAVAQRHGFAKEGEGAVASEPAPDPAPPPVAAAVPRAPTAKPAAVPAVAEDDTGDDEPTIVLRRRRKLRHRTQQFNVRLREDTIEAIYAESNARDVPLAQVIEEMVDVFLAQKGA